MSRLASFPILFSFIFMSLVFLLNPLPFFAQIHRCGTSQNCQESLKDRMLENRTQEAFLRAQIYNNPNTTLYIPLLFHICGTSDSMNYANVDRILATICKINQDFQNQEVQFFLHSLNYIPNSSLYNHGPSPGDNLATYLMSLHKQAGVINIFVGREALPSDEFLAYYASNLDVIYTFKTALGNNQIGITHELGHFFTLAHTFFGWEGTNYSNEVQNNKAPQQVGGRAVERMIRGQTGENCQWAADGFCDTPPDYASQTNNCPLNLDWRDPDSTLIDPDERNFMSYFQSSCISSFSQEQKNAILLDVYARGYHAFSPPHPLMVIGNSIPLSPQNNEIAFYPNAVHFRWQAADSASLYLLTIHRTFNNGSLVLGLEKQIVVTGTETWLRLAANQEYSWTIKALTSYDICSSQNSNPLFFKTGNWTLNVENIEQNSPSLNLYPNPLSQGNRSLKIEITQTKSTTATLYLYDALGRDILKDIKLDLSSAAFDKNIFEMELPKALPVGHYFIKINLDYPSYIVQKLLITE